MKVTAVVVTYNRSALLRECLEALMAQSRIVDEIVVVDNHSTDDTAQMLQHDFSAPSVRVYRLRSNYGGAGGFYFGMRKAFEQGADYVWAMDDDCICAPSALEHLLHGFALEPQASFMASKVIGPDGEPMNVPSVSRRATANGYPFWYRHLEEGMVEICDATLVSLLFRRGAVERCGLPHYQFFIWGDDYEYTTRLTRSCAPAFFVGKSLVTHKRWGAKALDFRTDNNPRTIALSPYFYRNMLANLHEYGGLSAVPKFMLRMLSDAVNIAFHQSHKAAKIGALCKGLWGYISGSYCRAAYRNRMMNINDTIDWE